MKMKYTFVLIFCLFMLYLFWGPLLPWSPVKIGYKKIETEKCTLYIKDMAQGDEAVYKLDEILTAEEVWHNLKYKDHFKIVVLDKNSNMKRYVPWLKGDSYSVNLGFMNLIYIGPIARRSVYGIVPYIKHELSHLLIHQNTPQKRDVFEMQKQGWFTEGIATYLGGPDFYGKREFVSACKARGLELTSLNETNIMDVPIRDLRLRYAYYKYFIEFLVETYGLEQLQEYIKKYLNNPEDYKAIFLEVYQNDLPAILDKFSSYFDPEKIESR